MRITDAQDAILSVFFGKYNRERSYIICESGNNEDRGFFGNFTARIFRKGVYRFYNCSEKGFKWEYVEP